MPSFGAINACIKVGGKELTEYNVQIDEGERKMTCWVPSEAGENFSVSWYNANPSVDTSGIVLLDGDYVGEIITRKGSHERRNFASKYVSSSKCRYFSFAPITYTDDDAYLGAPTQNIGEIKLSIWHVEIGQTIFPSEIPNDRRSHDAKVHERSKKLGAHRIEFGGEQEATPIDFFDVINIKPLATFIFKYRPLEMLQANGVAPLPPRAQHLVHPPRKGNKRKSQNEVIVIKDDSDDDDINERVNKLKKELDLLESRRAKKRKVKTEKSDAIVNEVIDLT